MEKTKRKSKNKLIQIFPSDGKLAQRRFTLLVICLGFLLFIIAKGGWILSWMLPFYCIAFFYTHLTASQGIVVYENGLEHYIGNCRTFVRWDALRHFRWRSNTQISVIGIVTYTPVEAISGSSIMRLLIANWGHYFFPLTGIIHIPKQGRGIDLYRFKKNEFGQLLYEHAPHLFDEKGKNS